MKKYANFSDLVSASVADLQTFAAEKFGLNFKKQPSKETIVKMLAGHLKIELPETWKADVAATLVNAVEAPAPTVEVPANNGANLIRGKFRKANKNELVEVKTLSVGAYFKTIGGGQIYKMVDIKAVEAKDKEGNVTGTSQVLVIEKQDFKPSKAGVASERYELTRENGVQGHALSVKADQNYPVVVLELAPATTA